MRYHVTCQSLTESQSRDESMNLQVRPKSMRKGKGGKQKGSPGPSLGFGSPTSRPTKGIPKRLVVKDVGSDGDGPDRGSSKDEDLVVDWSEGQQLMEVRLWGASVIQGVFIARHASAMSNMGIKSQNYIERVLGLD